MSQVVHVVWSEHTVQFGITRGQATHPWSVALIGFIVKPGEHIIQNVPDVHLSNAQPGICAVQFYLHYVYEFATPFHIPKVDVDMAVINGQYPASQIHFPLVKVEYRPHVKQFDLFVIVQLEHIS